MICPICLRATTERTGHHRACLQRLWGTRSPPDVEIDPDQLPLLAVQMVEAHATIPGVQRKLVVDLSADRRSLRPAAVGGRYILKPQSPTHAALPENEHLTMRLAALLGIDVPECGLVRLTDGSFAYVVARFDRPLGGGKRRQEDFCQLAGLRAADKYDRSADRCAELISRFSTQPPIDLVRLFRRVVFSWWVGNGDFHLKNVSLVENEEQRMQLSPAYDLMSTSVALGLAHTTAMMPGLGSRTWQQFAAQCGITPHAARRVLDNVSTALAPAEALIRASYLPLDQQHAYVALLRQRAWSIASNVPAPILAV